MKPLHVACLLACVRLAVPAAAGEPLARHKNNPSYLSFRGKATILVGSGEHYGAVVNPDFDHRRYLDTLAADGLNLTRLFVGTYYEKPGDFGIGANTLAPASGRALVPWARSDTPGAADGGAKFDLSRWNAAYFERLRGFVAEAGKRGIVVEVVLFSSYYGSGWPYSPLNAANNVNGVGRGRRKSRPSSRRRNAASASGTSSRRTTATTATPCATWTPACRSSTSTTRGRRRRPSTPDWTAW